MRPDEYIVHVKFEGLHDIPHKKCTSKYDKNCCIVRHTQAPKAQKPLKLGPQRSHGHKTYIDTHGSFRQTWKCDFALIAITVCEKSHNNTHKKANRRSMSAVSVWGEVLLQIYVLKGLLNARWA